MQKDDGEAPERVISWKIPEWFPEVGDNDLLRLRFYHKELLRFNKKINLISVNTIFDADALHFADSIIGGRLILKDITCSTIFDFGSGNGFPGMILGLLDRDRRVVLVEVDGRKAEFLRYIKDKLELKNVEVETIRVEGLPANSVECGVSRGLAQVTKSLMLTRKVIKEGGGYYHFKGDHWAVELAGIPSQLCSTWEPSLLSEYRLPAGRESLAIIKTTRIG